MPFTSSGNAKIYFETRGNPGARPAIFIEGFSAQMIGWREEFVQKFVDRGVHVIVFDNRDVGLSQKFGGPRDFDAGYDLADMADDAFDVLDTLGIERAHVVGQSMGGMIAQLMVLRRPERVRSLTLFYTAPSVGPYRRTRSDAERAGQSGDMTVEQVYAYLPRSEAIEAFIARERVSMSTAYSFDEEWIRALGERSFDRCYAPDGIARQSAAIARSANLLVGQEKIGQPAVIIHGRDDGHLKVEAAFDLGLMLRNSELHVYPGMGHELVEPLWDEWAGMAARVMERASR
jgi:pimeloyl-ACP methyl ester carboxylesterase